MIKSFRQSLMVYSLGMLTAIGLTGAEFHIDFSDRDTDPVGNWNIISVINTTNANLIDFNTGLATGVSVTTSGWNNENDHDSPGGFAAQKDWVVPDASTDAFVSRAPATVTISGLDAGNFGIQIVSSWTNANGIVDGDFQVEGNFADRNFEGLPGVDGDDFDANTDGRAPGNWLIWNSVPTAGGEIIITANPSDLGDRPILSAVQVTAPVPEPGTYLMFFTIIIGAVYMGMKNRKKMQEEDAKEVSA